MVIDREYTKALIEGRDKVQNGSIFTEEEIDHLLLGDDGVNEDFTTKLAEEAVLRTTGLRVDLAVQGSASRCVVRKPLEMSTEQAHATITVKRCDSTIKRFTRAQHDSGTVPKITPEDSNMAVKSLTWGGSRPRGIHGEGDRIADREGPIEAALMAQIHVAQVMNHWGADVENMIDYIDRKWDINYAESLVKNMDVAAMSELDSYLATGGRPTPQIYVSANETSKYRFEQRAATDAVTAGGVHAFFARASTVCQFTMLVTNYSHGMGSLKDISFWVNPAYISKFNTDQYSKIVFPRANVVTKSKFVRMIPHCRTYKEFVSVRQASAQNVRASELRSMTAIREVSSIRNISVADGIDPRYIARGASRDDNVVMYSNVRSAPSGTHVNKADPSRVTALLMNFFHGNKTGDVYGAAYAMSLIYLSSTCIGHGNFNIGDFFFRVKQIPIVGDVMRAINVESCMKQPDIATLVTSKGVGREFIELYLFYRSLMHTMPSMLVEMSNVQDKRLDRPLRDVGLFLATKMAPFKYVTISTGRFANNVVTTGIAGISAYQISRRISKSDSTGSTLVTDSFKLAIANARAQWKKFYHTKVQLILSIYRALFPHTTTDAIKNSDMPRLVRFGLYSEACEMIARELAVTFYKVSNKYLTGRTQGRAKTNKDLTLKEYTDNLKSRPIQEIIDATVVDPHNEKWDQHSAASVELHGKLDWLERCFGGETDTRAKIIRAYKASGKLVATVFNDAVMYDAKFMQGVIPSARQYVEAPPVRTTTMSAVDMDERLIAASGMIPQVAPVPSTWYAKLMSEIEDAAWGQNSENASMMLNAILKSDCLSEDIVSRILSPQNIRVLTKILSSCDGDYLCALREGSSSLLQIRALYNYIEDRLQPGRSIMQ